MPKDIKKDIGNKTKESLIWSTFLPAVFQLLLLAVSILIARILSPEDFGIMGIASIIIFYSDSFSSFGFSTVLIQKENISREHVNTVFTINLSISICLLLLTCILSKTAAIFFNVPELRTVFPVMSFIFIITTFYTIPETLLRRDMHFKSISKIEYIKGTSQSLIALLLAWLSFQYWSLVFILRGLNFFVSRKNFFIPCLRHQQGKVGARCTVPWKNEI
jgi:teichuronic acid exporter